MTHSCPLPRLALNLFTPLVAATLLCTLQAISQNATIQGHINSVPLNHPTMNAKVVIKKTDGQRVDSTYTDFAGDYFKAFTVTDVASVSGLPEGFTLKQNYPNPFNPSTKTELEVPKPGTVNVEVFDVLGQKVASNTYEVQPGVLGIDISGIGASGVYFLRATANEGVSKTIKMVNLGSGGKPSVEIRQLSSAGATPTVAKANLDVDSIDVEVSKPGYVTHTKRLPFNSGTVYNSDLQKVPKTNNFTLRPRNYGGDQLQEISIGIIAGSMRVFSQNGNVIRVQYDDYRENPPDSAKLVLVSSPVEMTKFMSIRKNRHSWSEPQNIAENNISSPVPSYANQPDTMKIPLNFLNTYSDTANLFLEPKWFYLPWWPPGGGRWISSDSDTVREVLDVVRSGKVGTGKWKTQPGADRIDVFQLGFNITTNQPVPSADSAKIRTMIDTLASYGVMADGDTLFLTRWHYPRSVQDSTLQAALARNTNLVYTYFEHTITPGNYLEYIGNPFSTSIARKGASRYSPSQTPGDIFSEILPMFHGGEEPDQYPGVGLDAYMVKNVGGKFTLSELGLNLWGKMFRSNPMRRLK